MKKIKLCIGLLSYCPDASSKRFEIFKKSIESIALLKRGRDDVYIYVWDNSSCIEAKEFLKSQDFFDSFHFSDKNLYDFVATDFLYKKAKSLNAEYVCHLEDDFYFYNENFLADCFEFMDNNLDCGTLRILKYEYNHQYIYDKFLNHPQMDEQNCQRHFNNISKQPLNWEEYGQIDNHTFYKNNWHWYNYPTICRTDVFEQIVPKHDHSPLQALEGYMMRKYFELGLKVGVMDIGAVTHLGNFNTEQSARHKAYSESQLNLAAELPVIKYEEILEEVGRHGV